MKPFKPPAQPFANASYAACRFGGTPPELAILELGLPLQAAADLERVFRRRASGAAEDQRPQFARHEDHVRAVLAAGGYPALPERRGR